MLSKLAPKHPVHLLILILAGVFFLFTVIYTILTCNRQVVETPAPTPVAVPKGNAVTYEIPYGNGYTGSQVVTVTKLPNGFECITIKGKEGFNCFKDGKPPQLSTTYN